jgi:hypothetical protein
VKGACLLLLLLGLMPLGAQNAVEQPFTISIDAPTPIVKAGADVWVNVQLKNNLRTDLNESGSISSPVCQWGCVPPNPIFKCGPRVETGFGTEGGS